METKMTLSDGFYRARGPTWSVPRLCRDSLRRILEIPKGTKILYAVFNKTDVQYADSYTITKPKPVGYFSSTNSSSVAESSAEMMPETKGHLAKMYKRGYRFVHFEYEV